MKKKQSKILKTIYQHITNNSKEYIVVSLIFIIGIFLGVMFINNTGETQISEITSYLNNYIETLKNTENLEVIKILRTSIFDNILLAITLWFFGTTVIRNTYSIWCDII